MSVPPKRRPKSGTRKRRSHMALPKAGLKKCPKCGQAVMPHLTCTVCGTYKGRQVIKLKTKAKKKTK